MSDSAEDSSDDDYHPGPSSPLSDGANEDEEQNGTSSSSDDDGDQPRLMTRPLPAYDQDDNVNGSEETAGSSEGANVSNDALNNDQEEPEHQTASSAPVAGFRVRVGEDGEEQIEFASDSAASDDGIEGNEEESETEEDAPVNEMMGVQPSFQFVLPINIVSSIADRLNGRRFAAITRTGQITGHRRVIPSNSARTIQTYYTNSPPRLPSPSPPPLSPPPRPAARRQNTTVRRRRRRKTATQSKKKARKPAIPSKPLGPLYLKEDWNGNANYKEYSKKIAKLKGCRVHINFQLPENKESPQTQTEIDLKTTVNGDKEEIPGPSSSITNNVNDGDATLSKEPECSNVETGVSSGYKIGQVQFDRCGIEPWLWKNKSELLAAHEDIEDLILYVSNEQSESILHLKINRVVSGEQIRERTGPPPKLPKRDSARELIYVVTQHYFYHVDPVGVPADLFSIRGLGYRKTFILDFNHFSMKKQCFIVDVVLTESAILGDHDVHSIPSSRSAVMQDVYSNFLGITPPPPPLEEDARQKEDIEWFYGQIRKYHRQEQLPPSEMPLQPAILKPQLRNYQRDAVHWMLYREGCLDHLQAHSSKQYREQVNLTESFLHKMYIPIELKKHITVEEEALSRPDDTVKAFYNPFTSYVCWKKPTVPCLPSGGILCDEMGLGKTVETLCLVLLNKKPIPNELQEDFSGEKMNIEHTEESSEPNGDVEEISSSSWNDVSSDSASTSDESVDFTSRKRKKRGKGRKKIKKPKKASVKAVVTSRIFRNRRRATSPCEFTTSVGTSEARETSDTEKEQRSGRPLRKSAQQARLTTKEALAAIEKNLGFKKKRKTKNGKEKAVPGQKYAVLKSMYETALGEFNFTERAKITPKFHGRFYETDIEMRECFECICGETDDGYGNSGIIKCSVCGSSQHMECVGFNEDLEMLYLKLERHYLCPHCEALEVPFETKSTLIITPQSISHQWIKEIQRHIQDQHLSILFYKGVSNQGYIPPAKLARYDIVITTYSVLSAELDYVDLPHCNSANGRRFRNPKRFLSIPSPLPSVMWWRVCLDEAQMVEGIGTKMSSMALRLRAVHRWCVTGTPVNKGLQDLFGLFVFLQVYPICYDVWWKALVQDAFFRKETTLLFELFGQLIWRNGKQDVLDQLGIPPQSEVIHWLNFSPVETHFYTQQYEICSSRILEKIQRLQRASPDVDVMSLRLSSLDRFTLNGLLAPFLELRQACCHPQIVKGQLISLQKGTLTMEELLDRLIKKTQMQCLDDHRQIVSALNGMAGIHIICNDWGKAAEKYREVLQSAEENKEHFKTDSLQLLHTLENLAEILDGNHSGIAFTLRDSALRTDAEDLRKKYMKKYADSVKAAQDVVSQHSQIVEETWKQFTMRKGTWYAGTLAAASRIQKIDGLINTLKQDLLDVTKKNIKHTNSIANRFNDRYSLERALIPGVKEIEDLRDSVLEILDELQNSDPSLFVDNAIRCHLRQKSNSFYNDSVGDRKCKLCMYHENFLRYESSIFKTDMKDKITRVGRNWQQRKLLGELADEITDKTKDELLQQEAEDLKATTEHVQLINEELRRGTWGDSETEVLLKGLLRFARVNKLDAEIIENGGVHIKLLEAIKKEFRFMRILWRQIFDQVSALDELSQATTRLIAVRMDDNQQTEAGSSNKIKQLSSGIMEKNMKIQNIHVIGYHELETKMATNRTDYVTGKESLSLHLGQLLYLNTLKRNGYGKRGTLNTEDCPICSVQLGNKWSVLRCGHSFCSDCVKKMCPNTLQSFMCPLCRHSMKFADVSFVDTTENEEEGGAGTSTESVRKARELKGSHSTKVGAIVETLLQLQDSHSGEKCIIFSMWTDVLEIIASALRQNDIRYSLLTQSGRAFHANLEKFKEREDLQVLLMPLTSGAKGLNIIEATHVCLVEPILNLASELQAIGRVHRIGQTKPTFVHRFYVKRTIEDKLYQILKVQDVSSDEEGSLTVKDLRNLITTSTVAK